MEHILFCPSSCGLGNWNPRGDHLILVFTSNTPSPHQGSPMKVFISGLSSWKAFFSRCAEDRGLIVCVPTGSRAQRQLDAPCTPRPLLVNMNKRVGRRSRYSSTFGLRTFLPFLLITVTRKTQALRRPLVQWNSGAFCVRSITTPLLWRGCHSTATSARRRCACDGHSRPMFGLNIAIVS